MVVLQQPDRGAAAGVGKNTLGRVSLSLFVLIWDHYVLEVN